MSIERVRDYLKGYGAEDRIIELDDSSATVELAAKALNCEPCRIAKSLSFEGKDGPLLVVVSGEAKVDNAKYKKNFGVKAKMIKADEVEEKIGHAAGGVCPFGINPGIPVYLDESLKRFDTVFPACGSSNSAIELTLDELEKYSKSDSWVDVCKNWQNV